jgi:hypothetical protein
MKVSSLPSIASNTLSPSDYSPLDHRGLTLVLDLCAMVMQYLLQALESRSSRLGLNELELKQLLNDVQEGRVSTSLPLSLIPQPSGTSGTDW